MRNGPGDSASSGAVAMTSRDLVSAFPSFSPTVRLLLRILVAIVVARAVTGIVIVTSVVVAGVAAVVALVVAAVLPAAAATTVLALVVVVATTTIPYAVIAADRAAAQNREGSIRVPTRLLDHDIAVCVQCPTLIDGVVVAPLSHLTPDSIDRAAIVAAVGRAAATENDVPDGAACQLTIAAVPVLLHCAAAQDRHVPIRVAARLLDDNVAVSVVGATLVDRIPAAILANRLPRSIDGGTASRAR